MSCYSLLNFEIFTSRSRGALCDSVLSKILACFLEITAKMFFFFHYRIAISKGTKPKKFLLKTLCSINFCILWEPWEPIPYRFRSWTLYLIRVECFLFYFFFEPTQNSKTTIPLQRKFELRNRGTSSWCYRYWLQQEKVTLFTLSSHLIFSS